MFARIEPPLFEQSSDPAFGLPGFSDWDNQARIVGRLQQVTHLPAPARHNRRLPISLSPCLLVFLRLLQAETKPKRRRRRDRYGAAPVADLARQALQLGPVPPHA